MLESRSEDALVLIVKLVKSTVMTVETLEIVDVLVFLWLENQTILLIMQYNFCFAFGNVFYLTN